MTYSPIKIKTEAELDTFVQSLTLEQKIGQMTLVQKNAISPKEAGKKGIGAILSGGGGNPSTNTPQEWRKMVAEFQEAAINSSAHIPLFYGVDAVHGHANAIGVSVFPHNIALAAANDPELVKQSAIDTAREMKAMGVNWNFAPVLSAPRDLRWGRVYETFGTDLDLISSLGVKYQQGLQQESVLATPKHFVGEGLEQFRTSKEYLLDQGEIIATDEELKKEIEPFHEAIRAGAMNIMISRSSWQGQKMSANKALLTDLLKTEFGFQGFLVSDWGAIDQISDDHYKNVVTAINAGIDMVMVPDEYDRFIADVTTAVQKKEISQERIDDAVRRILHAKKSIGLFSETNQLVSLDEVGSTKHRETAREIVRKSLVLLKNEKQVLPLLPKESLMVIGRGADDLGFQSGGWTVEWQGVRGNLFPGTTILQGLKEALPEATIQYVTDTKTNLKNLVDTAVVVVGEEPYAEGMGDRTSLELSAEDKASLQYAKQHAKKVVLLIIAGRPLPMSEEIERADAVVMAWLPGSEGNGIGEVMAGKFPFTGKLPLAWPKTMQQVEDRYAKDPAPLYPRGYGLASEGK